MDDFKPQQPDQPAQSGDTNDETQQTFTDNPTTYETTAVEEPIQSDETVTPAPVVMGKKKSPVKKWFLGFLVVLLMVALGGLSYWQWSEAQNARSEVATLRTSLEAAQKQNKADATTPAISEGKDLVDESTISSEALKAVEAFMNTKGVSRMTYEASIPYLDEQFARVVVNYTVPDPATGKNKPSGKGETFYFEKVQVRGSAPSWAMIANNPMTTDEINSMKSRYGVPEEVITGNKPA